MLKTLRTWLIAAPLAVLLILFALANRAAVEVGIFPAMGGASAVTAPALPLIVVLFVVLMVGFFVGAAASYASGAPSRKKAAERKREIRDLKRDLAAAKAEAGRSSALEVSDVS